MQDTITITKEEYNKLKNKAEANDELDDFISSLKDIKTEKVTKVR
jgi:hypothetical protein